MNVDDAMSSVPGLVVSLVPDLVPGKKGGEIGLPKCVHGHLARSTEALIERLEAYERTIAQLVAAIHAAPQQARTDGRPTLTAPP